LCADSDLEVFDNQSAQKIKVLIACRVRKQTLNRFVKGLGIQFMREMCMGDGNLSEGFCRAQLTQGFIFENWYKP
jgi:hypothetical protein